MNEIYLKFEYWNLFDICFLFFGIYQSLLLEIKK